MAGISSSSRIFVGGLPRSGTTWLAKTLAAAPGAIYVHEPDNRTMGSMGWLAWREVGAVPHLAPGDDAPDYKLMWELAFAGGWEDSSWTTGALHRTASSRVVPRTLRASALRHAARQVIGRNHVHKQAIVKSVFAALSLPWIDHVFDPTLVVVWRHPLNLTSAWLERKWDTFTAIETSAAIRERFEPTAAWPPPSGAGLDKVAWVVCAASVVLLEDAAAHPDWIVVSHEQQCLDPLRGFRGLFDRIGLTWTADVERSIVTADERGSGYDTIRRASEEPQRWRARLSADEQRQMLETMSIFEELSPQARALWSGSPAVVGS